jgi:hypothetical protein
MEIGSCKRKNPCNIFSIALLNISAVHAFADLLIFVSFRRTTKSATTSPTRHNSMKKCGLYSVRSQGKLHKRPGLDTEPD